MTFGGLILIIASFSTLLQPLEWLLVPVEVMDRLSEMTSDNVVTWLTENGLPSEVTEAFQGSFLIVIGVK